MGAAPTLAQLEKHGEKFMPPEVVGSGYEAKSRGRDARRKHNEAVDEVIDLYGLRPKGTSEDKVHALKSGRLYPSSDREAAQGSATPDYADAEAAENGI